MDYYYWHFSVEYDIWKYHWGVFLGFLYLAGIVVFARHVWQARSEGTIYNWSAVVTLFLAMGLVIFVVFIAQV